MGLWFEKILILFGCIEEMGEGSCVKEKEKGRKGGRKSCVENNFDTRKIETRL